MAQKQFKIGLSNTDKQNMAQDVYERVLALTFNEYDTTTEYEVGDFVVYNDQLYKCISATSGAWDNSKWQLATLNDLVADIEGAVAFVNDKANVDGNYPTMTVGAADNLTPYDEESGVLQQQPFLLQGTGCGNGEQQVDTGALALLKEKQGNSVVVNNYGKALNNTNWADNNSTLTFNDGIATFTATQQYGLIIQGGVEYKQGHKYLGFAEIKTTTATDKIRLRCASGLGDFYSKSTTDWQLIIGQFTYSESTDVNNIQIGDTRTSDWDAVQVKNVGLIDLAQYFGSNDNIPVHLLAHPEDFFRYYQGSLAYNEGTLVNSNGRYLKTIGRNQWDEETESGYINTSGEPASSNDYIRSKNFIKVIPNATYYIKCPYASYVTFYDKNNAFISQEYFQNYQFVIPSNCFYIKFHANSSTYNHDITISIYYDGESGYDQYYPYEELANNDTGTETLLAYDKKTPDGTIYRNTTEYTFTGSESWTQYGTSWVCTNAITKGAPNLGVYHKSNRSFNIQWASQQADQIEFVNPGWSTQAEAQAATTGMKIQYKLAEPTTEQGTPYSENVAIDDFGSMEFGGANGVPQGALIFYPVDYKAFVDTLYNYTDGTPSNIALKSDVASEQSARESVDTQLLNAVGGTLRQCLCVKENLDFDNTDFIDLGTLNWLYSTLDDIPAFASSVALADLGANKKSICSKYSSQDGYQTTDKTYTLIRGENGTIWVIDSSYTDATAFKNAMKGVLLAYEKASE